MKKRLLFLLIPIFIVVLAVFWIAIPRTTKAPGSSTTTASQASDRSKTPPSAAEVKPSAFDKAMYSISEPGSLWWVVSRTRPLPNGYVPDSLVRPAVSINSSTEGSLRADVATAVEKLFAGAKAAGFDYLLASGYRSQSQQAAIYNNYVAQYGQAEADTFSARPGTSEHQTGMALDVSRTDRKFYLEQAFGSDPAGRWLADHAHEYGFIVRYPEGKDKITGYMYEPWHIRYVGVELAAELNRSGLTMEEFFNL